MTKTNSNSGAKRKTGKNPKAKGPNQWTKVGSAQKTPSKTANGKSKTATITPSATATKPATIESMFGNQFAALAKEEEKQEALEEQKEKMEIAKKEAEEEAKKLRGGKKLSYAEKTKKAKKEKKKTGIQSIGQRAASTTSLISKTIQRNATMIPTQSARLAETRKESCTKPPTPSSATPVTPSILSPHRHTNLQFETLATITGNGGGSANCTRINRLQR